MPDAPLTTLALVVLGLAAWSTVVGERVRPVVLQRLAAWAAAPTLQLTMLRAAAVELAGLMVLSAWSLTAWVLGGVLGSVLPTRALLLAAAATLGPLWWAQARVRPGVETTAASLEALGLSAVQARTVAALALLGSAASVLVLLSVGAPSLWSPDGWGPG